MSQVEIEEYLVPTEVPLYKLDCIKAWNNLTDREKLYAHYLSRGSLRFNAIVLFVLTCSISLLGR